MSKSVLIDTHIFIWILTHSRRLKELKWLEDYPYWTVSPVSLLEMAFLHECGKISLELTPLTQKLSQDARFKLDNVSLEEVCLTAVGVSWTRDPFDRLLVAHSMIRSLPLGTCDEQIRQNYPAVI